MSLVRRVSAAIGALLGISAYSAPALTSGAASLDDQTVRALREAMGGQLSLMPVTRTRWYLADLETAQRYADTGDLSMAAQICAAMRRDGVISGVMRARCDGVIALPELEPGVDYRAEPEPAIVHPRVPLGRPRLDGELPDSEPDDVA